MIEEKLVVPNRKYIRIPGVPKRDPLGNMPSYKVKSEVDTTESYDLSETSNSLDGQEPDITTVVTDEVVGPRKHRSAHNERDREKKSEKEKLKEEGYHSDGGQDRDKGMRAWASRKLHKIAKKASGAHVLPADDLLACEVPPELNQNLNLPENSLPLSENPSHFSGSLVPEEVPFGQIKSHGKEEEEKKKSKWTHRSHSQIELNQEGEKLEDSAKENHEKRSKRERLKAALWHDARKPVN